jgi:uncharacterized protein
MIGDSAFAAFADNLRRTRGLYAKADVSVAAQRLGVSGESVVPVGDDCAAIPEHDGWLLFSTEGFANEFVAGDPWYAGWCGVAANVANVAAMGGRAIAVVDSIWSPSDVHADPVLRGLRDAASAYCVPIVGGHTNLQSDRSQLSVSILGRTRHLLSGFEAAAGEKLVAAFDLRGRFREPFNHWDAATSTPAERLRGDLDLLPRLAEEGLSRAARDIGQGGLVGTAAMLAECSGVSVEIDLDAVPRPEGVPDARWMQTVPSYGFLLSVQPRHVEAVLASFRRRSIAAGEVGRVMPGSSLKLRSGGHMEIIWDLAREPLTGCRPARAA